jgi:hypothetical protein
MPSRRTPGQLPICRALSFAKLVPESESFVGEERALDPGPPLDVLEQLHHKRRAHASSGASPRPREQKTIGPKASGSTLTLLVAQHGLCSNKLILRIL